MLIYLLKKFFRMVIGELPPEQRTIFWNKFVTLLGEVTEAATKGAVEGIKK